MHQNDFEYRLIKDWACWNFFSYCFAAFLVLFYCHFPSSILDCASWHLIDWFGSICQKESIESPTSPQYWFGWVHITTCIFFAVSTGTICCLLLQSLPTSLYWYHLLSLPFRRNRGARGHQSLGIHQPIQCQAVVRQTQIIPCLSYCPTGIMVISMRSTRVKQFLKKRAKFVFCRSKNTTKQYRYR